jgi:hypothetical protein
LYVGASPAIDHHNLGTIDDVPHSLILIQIAITGMEQTCVCPDALTVKVPRFVAGAEPVPIAARVIVDFAVKLTPESGELLPTAIGRIDNQNSSPVVHVNRAF